MLLPSYDQFAESIAELSLELPVSELHGLMCGFLCAKADANGETYLHALTPNKKDKAIRQALLALFSVYSVSQQQLAHFDFEFQMLLPDDSYSLFDRACGFSAWCKGFVEAIQLCGISFEQFQDEEAQDALQHFMEFSDLDSDALDMDEEDEQALMEVTEYARMAVLRLHNDLSTHEKKQYAAEKPH